MLPGVFRPKEALVTNCSERTGVKNPQRILQDCPHLVDHTRRCRVCLFGDKVKLHPTRMKDCDMF